MDAARFDVALIRDLAALTRHACIIELIAEVLGSNRVTLKVLEKSGPQTIRKRGEGVVLHVTLKVASA
jgi:hypothetical protein